MMKLPQAPLRTGYVTFDGGLDTETPPMSTEPGTVLQSQNVYRGVRGGYVTTKGYERVDGRPAPHLATYSMLLVTEATTAAVGDTITEVGGASGKVVAVVNDDAGKTLVLTKVVDSFATGDELLVGGVAVGEAAADMIGGGAETAQLDAYYQHLAAEAYRTDIAAPPGSGASLGGFYYKDTLYTFRNTADGLSAKLYKATSGGWSQVDLGREVAFTSGGTTEPTEGQTITGATSAATAILGRIIVTSGTWADGDAAGRLIIRAQTGTFQSENLNIGASLNVMTVGGDSAAITLSPGGRFECHVANFTADPATERAYGVDGVNYGWEFDGTTFVQIKTGMAADAPDKVYEHTGHLIYAYNGSFQNSAQGNPHSWTPVLGASEIGIGDQITGFATMPGSDGSPVLAIISRNSTYLLYGNNRDDWKLIPFQNEAGAINRSVQQIGQTYLLDTRGIATLSASDAFGNFSFSTVSDHIKRWLDSRKNGLVDSCVSRVENQYRLFFSNGEALYCTIAIGRNGNPVVAGMMPVKLAHAARWIWSSEDTNGNEVIFFGGNDGMVYQLDVGNSFDGAALDWSVDLHPVHFKTPNTFKKWRRCTLEAAGDGFAEYWASQALGYGVSSIEQPVPIALDVSLSLARLDELYLDSFYLDGIPVSPESFPLYGNAQNIALSFGGSSAYNAQLTFSGALLQYSMAREIR